jgi:hypothetical protein
VQLPCAKHPALHVAHGEELHVKVSFPDRAPHESQVTGPKNDERGRKLCSSDVSDPEAPYLIPSLNTSFPIDKVTLPVSLYHA